MKSWLLQQGSARQTSGAGPQLRCEGVLGLALLGCLKLPVQFSGEPRFGTRVSRRHASSATGELCQSVLSKPADTASKVGFSW
jgi:hypothetical protein